MRTQQEQQYVEYVTASLPWLRRLAQNLCKDSARVDDIVQAAITKRYVHWPQARRSDHLDAYVRKILVRAFLNERRLRWSDVQLIAEPPEAVSPPGRELETRGSSPWPSTSAKPPGCLHRFGRLGPASPA
ncbi:RNA polymerase sigma factor [Kribbella deserti]|uniref:RNA polymerase sigma factor n=1 Tax=Kribbella deserti TaxID=1926257 RepID=A0ABV6QRG1_9ACTN